MLQSCRHLLGALSRWAKRRGRRVKSARIQKNNSLQRHLRVQTSSDSFCFGSTSFQDGLKIRKLKKNTQQRWFGHFVAAEKKIHYNPHLLIFFLHLSCFFSVFFLGFWRSILLEGTQKLQHCSVIVDVFWVWSPAADICRSVFLNLHSTNSNRSILKYKHRSVLQRGKKKSNEDLKD